jgi:GT2 family glycosyltransferase
MTLHDDIRLRDNAYDPLVHAYETRTGHSWHDPAPPYTWSRDELSVVIPAHNVSHAITGVLDALDHCATATRPEVIVVDDASTDRTAALARRHPLRPTVLRLPERHGAGAARNVGTLAAAGSHVLYLDGDMVIPPHVPHEHVAKGSDEVVTVGFRHNLAYGDAAVAALGSPTPPVPDLNQDHRVLWRARAGRHPYTGLVLDTPIERRPLDDTRDLRDLGHGRRYYDWDLPRMVVTAMMAVSRDAVLDVGGFHPAFGTTWGAEDTHLGALLIAAGLKVVPLRSAVGFHLDPPDAAAQWRRKAATWERNITLYWRLLDEPTLTGQARSFTHRWAPLLAAARTLP